MGELAGKSIVVTGAGAGLGQAYAMASAAAGANVVVNDVNVADATAVVDAIQAIGGRAVLSTDPVGTAEAAEAMTDLCVDRFGRIDGLVNNAGIHYVKPVWEESAQEVERVIRVNLLGSIHCAASAIRRMRAQESGVVINIGSGSMRGNRPGMGAYGSSKAAVATLTRVWASELEGSGVHVYGISPNARTPMNLASGAAYLKKSLPEDIAPLAVFLLGDRARPLNGRMIRLDDGALSLWAGGDYGPVLGNRAGWTSDSLAAALLPAVATDAA